MHFIIQRTLQPSEKMARVSTVAVVVPSPAMSFVLEATCRTSAAPMFTKLWGMDPWIGEVSDRRVTCMVCPTTHPTRPDTFTPTYRSLNSMLLATVTPSFVILGAPKGWSMMAFRPLGPSVTCECAMRRQEERGQNRRGEGRERTTHRKVRKPTKMIT